MSYIELDVLEDHERFRAELASIAPDGRRRWVYARKPSGRYYKWRTRLSWFLLAFLLLAPFIKVGGHQLVLLNILKREFVFFGVPFWPNDFYLVALLFLTVIITFVLFTATIGRIWCGWLCPQTIFMEMVFRKIEWLIEGPPKEQAKRKAGPWNWDRSWRASTKLVVFAFVSFVIANVFLAYVISSDTLIQDVADGPAAHASLFIGLTFFTFVFFMVFYRFREQACIIACPYGRYMSALVDENTVAVTYDYSRGEKRTKWSKPDNDTRKAARESNITFKRTESKGDCVDCHQCVTVCPTGIDIRNGIQLECVNCTACIDACDEVMDKVGLERGLIRYASQTQIDKGHLTWVTPRIKAYFAMWLVLVLSVVVLFAMRSPLDIVVLRQEGTTWVKTQNGIGNFYRLQIINKSGEDFPFTIAITEPRGAVITPIGLPTKVASQEIMKGRFIVTIADSLVHSTQTSLTIAVMSNGQQVHTITTSFLTP